MPLNGLTSLVACSILLLKSRLQANLPLWFELPWHALLPGLNQDLHFALQWAHTDQA
jgi:hypothetical protein